MCAASSCCAPSVRAIVSMTSAGSRTGARPTRTRRPRTRSRTPPPPRPPAASSRPTRPDERHQPRRHVANRETTSATSCSRPTNEESGTGRFVFEIVRSGGKRVGSELEQRHRFDEVLQPVPAQAELHRRRAVLRVARETSTCPPCAALIIRAALCTSGPTYLGGASSGSPVCTPTRIRTGPSPSEAIACSTAVTAADADANA